MRIIFMGTPEFAVPTLVSLKEAGHEIACVVTQPDKPKGRGKEMQFPPVKEKALEYGIPVLQPLKVKEPSEIERLREFQPDVIVVVAFGQILPPAILEMPKYGCVNVHASLLPMYRGAAPIQWVILNGEKETGVTIMKMDKGLDTGDMIRSKKIAIAPDETGDSLHDKLSVMGGPLLLSVLNDLENGTCTFTKQEGETCYASMLTKQMGEIDWTKSAAEIERLIRGLNSWPSAYTKLNGKTLKIWKAEVLPAEQETVPGRIHLTDKAKLLVETGEGILSIEELQLEGKKRMDTENFLRGCHLEEGLIL